MRRGAALVALIAAACATTPREPLRDLHPVAWSQAGVVTLHTCRWPDRATIPVTLDPGMNAGERTDAALAADAWSGAGLGVVLQVEHEEARGPSAKGVRIRFVDEAPRRSGGRGGTGRTVADCERRSRGGFQLVTATIEVARLVGPDWKQQTRPLAPDERLGTLVHELGHALGFAGHVDAAAGPMVAAPEAIARVGRELRAGRSLRSAALAALYRRPSGALIGRADVEAWRTEDVDALATVARDRGWQGPFLRAGDTAAEIVWRDERGAELGVRAPDLARWRRAPAELLWIPNAALRAWFRAQRPDARN